MDPKTAQLDPKLKEAYERVMGTAMPASGPQAPKPVEPALPNLGEPTSPPTQNGPTPPTILPNPSPQPSTPGIITNSGIITPSSTPKTPNNPPSVKAETTFVANSGKSRGIPPILIFLLLILFFAGYAIFWVKFFNLSVPYLSGLVIPGVGKLF